MWIFDNESKELIIENPEYPFDPIHWSFKAHEQTGPDNVDSSLFAGNVPVHAEYTPPVTEGGFYKLEQKSSGNYRVILTNSNTDGDWSPIIVNHVAKVFSTESQLIDEITVQDHCVLYDAEGWTADGMFGGLKSLESLDLTNVVFSNMTSMVGMFTGDIALSSLTFGDYFDTSQITSSEDMFYECNSLTSLDLSGWDGSNVANTKNMFCHCSGLVELNISGWDFCSLSGTAVTGMFSGCTSLKTLTMDYCDVGTIKAFLGYRYKDGTLEEQIYGYLAEGTMYETLIEHLSLKHCTINVEEEMWPTTERSVKARNLLTGCDYLQDVDLTDAVIKAGPDGETPGAEFDLTKCTSLDNDSYYAVAEALMTNPTLHAIPLPKVLVYTVYTPAQEVAQSKNWEWATS